MAAPSLLHDSRRLGLEWRDPPALDKSVTWPPLLALLRERPGVWAVLRRYPSYSSASGTASRLRARYREFEFAARRSSDGGGEVFGRLKAGGR